MERFRTNAEMLAALHERPYDKVTVRGNLSAGALIRTRVRAALRSMEMSARVTADWTETRGFLESYFTYRVSGTADDVEWALVTMQSLLPSIEED